MISQLREKKRSADVLTKVKYVALYFISRRSIKGEFQHFFLILKKGDSQVTKVWEVSSK